MEEPTVLGNTCCRSKASYSYSDNHYCNIFTEKMLHSNVRFFLVFNILVFTLQTLKFLCRAPSVDMIYSCRILVLVLTLDDVTAISCRTLVLVSVLRGGALPLGRLLPGGATEALGGVAAAQPLLRLSKVGQGQRRRRHVGRKRRAGRQVGLVRAGFIIHVYVLEAENENIKTVLTGI